MSDDVPLTPGQRAARTRKRRAEEERNREIDTHRQRAEIVEFLAGGGELKRRAYASNIYASGGTMFDRDAVQFALHRELAKRLPDGRIVASTPGEYARLREDRQTQQVQNEANWRVYWRHRFLELLNNNKAFDEFRAWCFVHEWTDEFKIDQGDAELERNR